MDSSSVERTAVSTMDGDDDDDDFDSDEDWDEMDDSDDDSRTLIDCLFCKNKFPKMEAAVSHCYKSHGLDLPKLKGRHNMDCYSYIKLVNYVRSTHPSWDEIMSCQQPLWSDDKYLVPVNNQDPWLSYDFDDVDEIPPLPSIGELPVTGYPVNVEDGRVTLSAKHFFELQKSIRARNEEIRQKDEALTQMLVEANQMRETIGAVVGGQEIINHNVSTISAQEDKEYFNTYTHFGIHHEMLLDEVRTLSYRNAIYGAGVENKLVLDLGCGTGILSMFAAQAGAAKVMGIDQSDIIFHTMDIVRENQLEDKISLVKGRIEDTELPEPKVDVIVSEWMGYFLLFEAMLDSVIYARDKHLRPGGLLLPSRCSLSVLAINDQESYKNQLGFWSDVYGFGMSSLRSDVVQEPQVSEVHEDNIATTSSELCLLDMMTVTTDSIEFESDFLLTSYKDTELTALVGYFDVFFDLPKPVMFSTSPHCKPTHWKQTVFFLEKPIPVEKGEEVRGKLVCQRNKREVRSLTVTITIGRYKQQYLLR